MNVSEIVWLEAVVDKLAQKHGVEVDEVEQVLVGSPRFRFVAKGTRKGEDVYMATGQTADGRFLTVLFIYKSGNRALILSARDMAAWERKRHERK
jgi:uncharacterized DUF497 family protein